MPPPRLGCSKKTAAWAGGSRCHGQESRQEAGHGGRAKEEKEIRGEFTTRGLSTDRRAKEEKEVRGEFITTTYCISTDRRQVETSFGGTKLVGFGGI